MRSRLPLCTLTLIGLVTLGPGPCLAVGRFLIAAATVASLCYPISDANACFVTLEDTRATSGGGSVADTSSAEGSGISRINAVVPRSGPRERSESMALLSSILGTGLLGGGAALAAGKAGSDAPANALFLTAYMVGPSIGHFYAGRAGRAFIGIGIRGAALVGFGYGVILALADERDPNTTGTVLITASLVLGAGSVLFDIIDAPHSARVHNRKVRTPLAISPAAVGGAPGVRVDVGM